MEMSYVDATYLFRKKKDATYLNKALRNKDETLH
jgi:hypothetical protein